MITTCQGIITLFSLTNEIDKYNITLLVSFLVAHIYFCCFFFLGTGKYYSAHGFYNWLRILKESGLLLYEVLFNAFVTVGN